MEGFFGSLCIMPSIHPAENPVIKGLHSHTDSIRPKVSQPFDISGPFFNDIFRIYFNGKFLVWTLTDR